MPNPDMDLATLIRSHRGDRSYDGLSRDSGGAPSGGRLHQLATAALKSFPDRQTIEALARGLSVSVTTVVLACARSLGLDVHLYDTGVDLNGLSPTQADAVRAVVRAMLQPPTAAAG